ncbi:MAG: hypothetical protein IAF02_16900 [Anaerolineae bacterium]|nr:hypothetical protein [Anaerolineae bacterium]
MESKGLNSYVTVYKELLKAGDVQIAYAELVKYVQKLRTEFSKSFGNDYATGNVLQGYMDYTYFYISNDYLKSKKLKLALVLNHAEANFEIWLLGQTKDIQEKYWKLLKNTKWIKAPDMPQYSVFEVTLVKNPNFENLDKLTNDLKKQFLAVSNEILDSLKEVA